MAHQPLSTTESPTRPLSAMEGVNDAYDLGIDTPRGSTYGLQPPRASYLDTDSPRLTPRGSENFPPSTPHESATLLSSHPALNVQPKEEVNQDYADEDLSPTPKNRKGLPNRLKRIILCLSLSIILLILLVVLPVYFKVIKKNKVNTAASSGEPSSSATTTAAASKPTSASTRITGGDGSEVTTEDGSKFTYKNSFGGFWVQDPNSPFNNNAQPNSWTPPLNTSWNWGKDKMNGVNLGGLFVMEPFITPALYQKYPGAVDEWTLSTLMAADTASGGLKQLEDHYNTFITEQDIAEIAGAGLNWVRLPIPFWAVDTWPGEPFLAKTSWKYIVRLLGWCRKYGLRVNLDLHTCPGSQNSFNHSGKGGQVNFLYGVMGIANAQRLLNYIRIITEFISQPEYRDLVVMFGIINEADVSDIGMSQITSFYHEAHDMIRTITGKGEGKGPFISIGDGFKSSAWTGFLEGSDRVALDNHPYFAFSGTANDDPIDTGTGINAGGTWPAKACGWASGVTSNQQGFGVTLAGEFSNGFNDCGLFLLGPGLAPSSANCPKWQDASTWDDATKAGIKNFAMASMDALQNWFFWTWKVGNSTAGKVESPLWSYKLGLEGGWIPKDPRDATGFCTQIGQAFTPFDGTFKPWQTGGAGAGDIAEAKIWPPVTLSPALAVVNLPTYTPTGAISTLPPPSFSPTPKPSPTLNGWFNAADTTGAPAEIAGCVYPNAWDAVSAAPGACGGARAAAPAAATAAATVPAVVPAAATVPAVVPAGVPAVVPAAVPVAATTAVAAAV